MSEENLLSRRQSLLGIGATGATLAGMAGCLGNDETAKEPETDGEQATGNGDDGNGDENGDETGKKGTLALEVVCHEPGTAQLRVRNKATGKVKVDWKVKVDDVDLEALAALLGDLDDIDEDDLDDDLDDIDEDDLDDLIDELEELLEGTVLEDIDPDDLKGKQITLEGTTLSIGKKEIDLKAVAAKKGIDLDDAPIDLEKLSGTLTVPKDADETFWAGVLTEGTNVELYYDGKKVESVDIDVEDCKHEKDANGDAIDVEAVCYEYRKIDFADLDGAQLENTYDSDVTDVTEDFDPDGEMIVDGEEVDEDDYDDLADLDDDTDVLAESDLTGTDDLEGLEGVAKVRKATFRVHNHGKTAVKVSWTVKGDEQGGKLTVDGQDSATFCVTEHNDRKTTVIVTHDDEKIAAVKPADAECTETHDA